MGATLVSPRALVGSASVAAQGRVTAPAANAAIATIPAASLGAGEYAVTAWAAYGGTADVVDNMNLRVGGVAVVTLPVHVLVNALPPVWTFPRLTVAAGETITVNAIAAGGVGTVFAALLVATRLGRASVQEPA